VRTKLHDGHLYLITCNVDENPAGVVTFTIPPQYRVAGGSAEVMFEDRKVDVSGNSFADTFEGHARHVYKLKIRSVK